MLEALRGLEKMRVGYVRPQPADMKLPFNGLPIVSYWRGFLPLTWLGLGIHF